MKPLKIFNEKNFSNFLPSLWYFFDVWLFLAVFVSAHLLKFHQRSIPCSLKVVLIRPMRPDLNLFSNNYTCRWVCKKKIGKTTAISLNTTCTVSFQTKKNSKNSAILVIWFFVFAPFRRIAAWNFIRLTKWNTMASWKQRVGEFLERKNVLFGNF